MFKARENIDTGTNILVYPTWDPTKPNPFVNHFIDSSAVPDSTLDLSFMSGSESGDG